MQCWEEIIELGFVRIFLQWYIFLRKMLICQNCSYFWEKLIPVSCPILKKMEKSFEAVKIKCFKKVK